MFLNSRTYGGGDNFVWDKAKGNLFHPQSPVDRMLEVLVFFGKFNVGLEQVFPGRAKKISQGFGPYEIKFKDMDDNKRVYMQIDGQYFYANKPATARIELSDISKEQLINILRKKK